MTDDLSKFIEEIQSEELEELEIPNQDEPVLSQAHHSLGEEFINDPNNAKDYVVEEVQYPYILLEDLRWDFEVEMFRREPLSDDIPLMLKQEIDGETLLAQIGWTSVELKDLLNLFVIKNYNPIIYFDKDNFILIDDTFLNTQLLT